MKSLPLFLHIISLHFDALSPSLFQSAYHFKIGVFILVPKVLIYCIYDTFIASEIPTTKVRFSALGKDKCQKGLNLEKTGDEEGLRSRIQSQQRWQLATCEQVHYPARAERLESTFPLLFLTISWRSRLVLLHNMHRLSCDLPQDNQPWLLPDYPKR